MLNFPTFVYCLLKPQNATDNISCLNKFEWILDNWFKLLKKKKVKWYFIFGLYQNKYIATYLQ